MKRLCDIVLSTLGLIIFCPLFLVLSLWVALDSTGGVFYRQTRVGRGGRDFKLLKFRSMRIGADKKGLITVGEKDARITKSGYYIRKYKFDELPQLINVLKGDMSFVGPRPEVRKYVELYTDEQLRVLNVRPGITDPASIQYSNENELLEKAENPEQYYIDTVMPDKLRINLEYLENRTLWSDFKVIIKTISKVW